jgi:uncharacterized protein YgiM (DUF1202 family)
MSIQRRPAAFALAVLTTILAVGALAATAHAAEVEAKKDGVEVYADATNKSVVLSKLKEGEALPATERKGMFWQVKTKDGKAGYVSVLVVKHKPDANGDLAKAIKNVVKQGRSTDEASETRARSAVMGVRGLREDDDAGNAGNVRPNMRAVYSMEDDNVKKKDIDALGENVLNEIATKAGG